MTREAIERIERVAYKLARKYGTSDPYELAESLNCMVDMESYPSLLGFCNVIMGVRVIGLNSNADYYTRRCACAHELGHLVLGHVKLAGMRAGRTEDLTNLTSRMEAEANCFAAALLISDEDALNAIRTYCELSRAAASLYVCPELLQAKARILSAKGCAVIVPELPSNAAWKRCARKACGC